MAVTLVQHDFTDSHAGNVTWLNASPVATGSTVVLVLVQISGTGTISGVADAVNGSYTQVFNVNGDGRVLAYVKRNVTTFAAGAISTASIGTDSWGGIAWELSGCDNSATIQTDTLIEVGQTNHFMATTGITGTGFFAGGSEFNTTTNLTEGSGWTTYLTKTGTGLCVQHKIEAGSAERGPFTTSGSVNGNNGFLFIPESAADPRTDGRIVFTKA